MAAVLEGAFQCEVKGEQQATPFSEHLRGFLEIRVSQGPQENEGFQEEERGSIQMM